MAIRYPAPSKPQLAARACNGRRYPLLRRLTVGNPALECAPIVVGA
jgi:hypothetical protein